MLAAADAGADDVERDGSDLRRLLEPRRALGRPCRRSRRRGSGSSRSGLSMVPKTTVAIGDESTAKQVVRLVEGLEEFDDVQDVYANFDIPETVLEAVAS